MKELFILTYDLDTLFEKTDKVLNSIQKIFPITQEKLEDEEYFSKIDSFIFRVSKIQDILGAKFFKYSLMELLEYEENMSMIDILNKLEKLGILKKQEWIEFRNLRNFLTHMYITEPQYIEENLKESFKMYQKLKQIYQNLKSRVISET